MSRFLEIAGPLAKLNVPTTPVRPGTKRAVLPDFPTTATTDLDQLTVWDIQFPDHNAASVARAEEGGVFFWEVDSPDVRERVLKETGNETNQIKTFRVRSRQGRGHFYFRHNAESLARLTNLSQTYVKGGDWSLRVDREYVVAPGSIHPDTGLPYTALNWDTPIAEAPSWLIDWLLSQKIQKVEGSKAETLRNERGLVPHGKIHGWMLTQAGKLRHIGLNQGSIETALLQLVHDNCEPPIDDSKVAAMAKSICNYATGEDNSLLLNQGAESNPIEITQDVLAKEFPAFDGTEPEELPMLIQGFMPKGVGFFGSLSGTGKTWCGLSVAKALSSGTPLWGVFPVNKQTAILYLVPEASDASFKRRLMKMRMTQDKNLFRYRTITQGITRPLSDPVTVAMIQQLSVKHDVLVIVDTAVRFFRGGDENAAKENNLVQDSDMLRSIGANVLFLHHSPKATKDAAELTLENALRGTGDFGAMADFVYAFRRDEKMFAQGEGPEEIEVVCVKPRDFEPPLPFRLQLKRKAKHGEQGPTVSVIDETGDLGYIGNATVKNDNEKLLADIFHENPYVSFNDLCDLLKMKRESVRGFCKRNGGWKQVSESAPGARGKTVTRKKWTQGLLMAGQVEQTTCEPVQSGPSVSLDAVTEASPGENRPVHSMVTVEDVAVGF